MCGWNACYVIRKLEVVFLSPHKAFWDTGTSMPYKGIKNFQGNWKLHLFACNKHSKGCAQPPLPSENSLDPNGAVFQSGLQGPGGLGYDSALADCPICRCQTHGWYKPNCSLLYNQLKLKVWECGCNTTCRTLGGSICFKYLRSLHLIFCGLCRNCGL